MKNSFITKIIGASLAIAMMIGVGASVNAAKEAKEVNAAESTATWAISSTNKLDTSKKTGTFDDSEGNTWTWTSDKNPGNLQSNNTCQQIGASGNPATVSFSTSDITDTIKSVAVECASYQAKHTIAITVGATAYLAATATPSWTTVGTKSGTGNSTGEIVISFTPGNNARAMYIKSITVVHEASNQPTVTASTAELFLRTGGSGENVTATGSNFTGAISYSWAYRSGVDCVDLTNALSATVTMTPKNSITELSTGVYRVTASYSQEVATTDVTVTVDNGGIAHPYSVAEARAAINTDKGTNNAYVSGIVSKIVTAYNAQAGFISYNISDDGKTTSDQLQAYKGRSFDGVDFTSEDDIKVGAAVVVYGNLTKYGSTYEFEQNNQLVAYTEPFTVSFETNGGSSVASQIVLDGEKAQRPADPTKAGTQDFTYLFVDWYDNSEFNGDAYDFDTPVTADLVLYAKWNEIPAPAKDVIERATTKTQLSYHYEKEGTGARDYLDRDFTGVESTNSYLDWNDKTASSNAVYAGNSCGNYGSIQLRSDKKTSGIITTTSAGKATLVKLYWNSHTASGRTITVYGKNTAYESAEDLYDAEKQGTEIGSIVCGTSTKLVITGDYQYIGLRANNALYLDSVMIQWGELSYSYSNMSIRFGGNVDKALWNRLNTESTIVGFGVMITESKNVENFEEFKDYIDANMFESAEDSVDVSKDIVDYYVPVANMATTIGEDENNYFWNLRWSVDESDMNKPFSAIAYVKISTGFVLMDMATESVETMAAKYIASGAYNGGVANSLQYIIDNAD